MKLFFEVFDFFINKKQCSGSAYFSRFGSSGIHSNQFLKLFSFDLHTKSIFIYEK